MPRRQPTKNFSQVASQINRSVSKDVKLIPSQEIINPLVTQNDGLTKNLLSVIALKLKSADVVKLATVNKEFNEVVGRNNYYFWQSKLAAYNYNFPALPCQFANWREVNVLLKSYNDLLIKGTESRKNGKANIGSFIEITPKLKRKYSSIYALVVDVKLNENLEIESMTYIELPSDDEKYSFPKFEAEIPWYKRGELFYQLARHGKSRVVVIPRNMIEKTKGQKLALASFIHQGYKLREDIDELDVPISNMEMSVNIL